MKYMKRIVEILFYLWQLPQNIVGLLLVLVLRPEQAYDFGDEEPRVRLYYASRMRGGISLGKYVIMRDVFKDYRMGDEQHELGHSIQSRYLGPLYLVVIGLPSLLWACWWNEDRNRDYYSFYTERWADRLGGVNRC